MKTYKSKDTITAVQWTGNNVKEIIDFVGYENVAWKSKEMTWTENNPPKDLELVIIDRHNHNLYLGDYIVKHQNGRTDILTEDVFDQVYEVC